MNILTKRKKKEAKKKEKEKKKEISNINVLFLIKRDSIPLNKE